MSYHQDTQDLEIVLNNEHYTHAADHLIGLVEDIYGTGSIQDIEFHLEELLGAFGLKIPDREPEIQTRVKERPIDHLLQGWVDYSRAYAKALCPKRKT